MITALPPAPKRAAEGTVNPVDLATERERLLAENATQAALLATWVTYVPCHVVDPSLRPLYEATLDTAEAPPFDPDAAERARVALVTRCHRRGMCPTCISLEIRLHIAANL